MGWSTSSPFHQKHYEMKLMDFFVKLGADPQSHWQCGKGMQRRMTEKDAISWCGFGETDYQTLGESAAAADQGNCTDTRRGFTPRRGKSTSAASNMAASVALPATDALPSLLARDSKSGLPLLRSRISTATSRS